MSLDKVVEFENVSVYQQENLVLADVTLSIEKGEFVYLIGKVGSGKSSFIKTINAELPLKKGEAKVCGYNLGQIKQKQIPYLRRKLGIVFQDFQLLPDRSVHDNLAFVLHATGWKSKKEINVRIGEVLEKTGLTRKDYKMPHQLSGGEQQRVVVARALLNDPEVILADEPTGNLDPETSSEIMELLLEISRNGRAIIMATHNHGLLKRYPSRTLRFEKGHISESDQLAEIDFSSLME
jgi:cell division transport system ATP-binding protein